MRGGFAQGIFGIVWALVETRANGHSEERFDDKRITCSLRVIPILDIFLLERRDVQNSEDGFKGSEVQLE